jgi:hypothetical protein
MRWIWLVLCGVCSSASAQISPPGLGAAQTAGWLALGARQDLDARDRRESMTYVGLGAVSDIEGADPLRRPAIVVVNQELYDQFAPQWTYSLALSYRRQNEYEEGHVALRQRELRVYGRFSHVCKRGRFKLTDTLRPEARNFFGGAEETFQFRLRARAQLAVAVDRAGQHRVLGSAEALGALNRTPAQWSAFRYTESRFCLYYSLDREPVAFNVGYMNNLLGRGAQLIDVHYLAFDITWKNPFGKPTRQPTEYLE